MTVQQWDEDGPWLISILILSRSVDFASMVYIVLMYIVSSNW